MGMWVSRDGREMIGANLWCDRPWVLSGKVNCWCKMAVWHFHYGGWSMIITGLTLSRTQTQTGRLSTSNCLETGRWMSSFSIFPHLCPESFSASCFIVWPLFSFLFFHFFVRFSCFLMLDISARTSAIWINRAFL